MSKKMSYSKRAALETLESISRKVMVWAPLVAFFAWITHGKFITTDVWEVLIPLGIVAGVIWFWAAGQLPDNDDEK